MSKMIKILNFKNNPFPYLLRSDLFILSSKFEGLPNVLLEAITLNKFVISTNCSTGPSEILVNGKGGILIPIKNSKKIPDVIFHKGDFGKEPMIIVFGKTPENVLEKILKIKG